MPVIGSLRFCDVACRHVDCANIAFSEKVREKNGEGKFEEPRVDAGP
jgi:hypothetical protein